MMPRRCDEDAQRTFRFVKFAGSDGYIGVSRATIDRWRKDKKLPHIKIGKEIWVDKNKLQAWVHLHARAQEQEGTVKTSSSSSRVITVGYQSGAALLWSTLVIKKLGLFEEELRGMAPSADFKVKWVNAPNGMELVEELIGGNLHIASIGDYPLMASRALSHVLPRFKPLFLAFDGKTRNGAESRWSFRRAASFIGRKI